MRKNLYNDISFFCVAWCHSVWLCCWCISRLCFGGPWLIPSSCRMIPPSTRPNTVIFQFFPSIHPSIHPSIQQSFQNRDSSERVCGSSRRTPVRRLPGGMRRAENELVQTGSFFQFWPSIHPSNNHSRTVTAARGCAGPPGAHPFAGYRGGWEELRTNLCKQGHFFNSGHPSIHPTIIPEPWQQREGVRVLPAYTRSQVTGGGEKSWEWTCANRVIFLILAIHPSIQQSFQNRDSSERVCGSSRRTPVRRLPGGMRRAEYAVCCAR